MTGKAGKSGGAREGAGRNKNPENEGKQFGDDTPGKTPLELLELMMNDAGVPIALRIAAAKAAAPYVHQKLGETGKKEGKQDAAKSAAGGKFAPAAPPRLAAANGKKL